MTDTIIRTSNKTENFTIVSNEVPRRTDLSARAKGLYFYLMTLPKNWTIHKAEIYKHFTEGRDALDTAFNELMNAGYISMEVTKEKGKFVSFSYTIYEETINGKPVTGKPLMENPQLLSIDSLLNTDKQSNKTNIKKPGTDYTPAFKSFWESYPKKECKKKAFIIFNRLLKDGTGEEIINERLKTYKARIQALNTSYGYIRNPDTFLNNLEDYADGFVPEKTGAIIKQRPLNLGTKYLDMED